MAAINPYQQRPRVLLLNPFTDRCKEVLPGTTAEENEVINGHLYAETPLGLTYVYTYAKTKLPWIDFYLLDGMGILVENSIRGMEHNWNLLTQTVSEIKPDVIGIGAYYFKSAGLFHETCKRIKQVLPDTVIVAGGNYPTDVTDKVLDDTNVNYILVSEGELSFTEFLKAHFAGGDLSIIDGIAYVGKEGHKHINKKKVYIDDLSDMPIPDRSPLPMHLYGRGRNALDRILTNYKALGMTVSRGCPYVCTFCTATNFWDRKIRYRSAKDVLDEMEMLKVKYGATVILIDDDNFLIHKKRVSEILQGMIDRKLDLKWIAGGGSNVKILNSDDAFLDLVIRSGYCYFNLAIESSSNETLKRIKKPLKVEETVSLIKKVRTRYPHMYLNAYFMVGFPFETQEQIMDTLKFSGEIELDWCSHYIFKPYPNTELFQYCLENDYIDGFDLNFGELFKETKLNGPDWTSGWLFEKNYEYNLRVNFLNNRNMKYGNFSQALQDFEYIISITSEHALAYRQAAVCAEKLGDHEKASRYSKKEQEIFRKETEFKKWYKILSLDAADPVRV